jgi:CubicO group peptidase (beta-lactamase class C family)
MDTSRLDSRIRHSLESAIEEGLFPGAVAGYVFSEGRESLIAAGRHTYAPESAPVRIDAIYDVASITKAIPTSSLALQALEEGLWQLESPLSGFLPEFGGPYRHEVTIRHLLTHTLDFGLRLSGLKDSGPKEILDRLLAGELTTPPGTGFSYSNASSILLGLAVERVLKQRLDKLARNRLFDPLGMSATAHSPAAFVSPPVPTEIDRWRGRTIRGEIHDESAWVLRNQIFPGSAGLFSNAPDLLKFMKMLLAGGESGDVRLFREETISTMAQDAIPRLEETTGLGWELNQPRYMGDCCSPKTIGKTGFTGCVVMADLLQKRALVLLSNATYPDRHTSRDQINRLRRQVADLVFGEG